jgi:hypothetical protein
MRIHARVWLLAAVTLSAGLYWFASTPRALAQVAAPAAQMLPAEIPRPPYRRLVGPQTLNPGAWPNAWPYPDEYDSTAAASAVHHLRYVDAKVRFVEVAYFPGVHGQMHGHPYASVFAIDAPAPKSVNVRLDVDRPPVMVRGPAPKGRDYPSCNTMGPEPPHAETNQDTWPHHFYRLEFVRLDGAAFAQHWREWYPHMLDPLPLLKDVKPRAGAAKFSADWPFPIAFDSVLAAPNNHKLLYEDDHVRLIEVTIRPGETENLHGHPYPSVFAFDASFGKCVGPPGKCATAFEDHFLHPDSLMNGNDRAVGGIPAGLEAPNCAVLGPQAPHAAHNKGHAPLHFYRIEFKRIDGDGLKTHWRQWYPWMARLTDEYAKTPYVLNY